MWMPDAVGRIWRVGRSLPTFGFLTRRKTALKVALNSCEYVLIKIWKHRPRKSLLLLLQRVHVWMWILDCTCHFPRYLSRFFLLLASRPALTHWGLEDQQTTLDIPQLGTSLIVNVWIYYEKIWKTKHKPKLISSIDWFNNTLGMGPQKEMSRIVNVIKDNANIFIYLYQGTSICSEIL